MVGLTDEGDGDGDCGLQFDGLGASMLGLPQREDETEGAAPVIFVFAAPAEAPPTTADAPPPSRLVSREEPDPSVDEVLEAARRLGQRSGEVRRNRQPRAPRVAPVFPSPPPTRRRPPPWYRPPRLPGQR